MQRFRFNGVLIQGLEIAGPIVGGIHGGPIAIGDGVAECHHQALRRRCMKVRRTVPDRRLRYTRCVRNDQLQQVRDCDIAFTGLHPRGSTSLSAVTLLELQSTRQCRFQVAPPSFLTVVTRIRVRHH